MNIQRFLGATALVGVLSALPAVVQAQTAPAPSTAAAPQTDPQTDPNASGQDEGGEIVITGSRIAQPGLESPIPITSLTGEQLSNTGRVSAGDVLNDLPALASTFSQQNSTRFLGTSGLNLLDLRGLGTQRTLVLVNGRRHVGADILNNAVSPDVNTFPTDLIDRVEVVTGGNSAVYGSDAIAGVVNFVLKDHFEGVQIRGQGAISQYGDAGAYYGSILAGKNFAEGRGNIAIDLEYARQNSLYASDRPYLQHANGFVTVDTDPAGVAPGQTLPGYDGNPDAVFMKDVRPLTISNNGNVLFGATTGPGIGRCGAGPNGTPTAPSYYVCPYIFQANGSLVPQTGSRVGLGPNGSMLGGNGDTLREGQLVQIQPQLERYSANLIGHFEISPAIVPFVEASFVRTNSLGQGASGPAFIQGTTLGDPAVFDPRLAGLVNNFNRETPRLDNPFLSAQARGVITQQLLLSNPAAVVTDATQFTLRKNLLDVGVRTEQAQRDTYRIVGGVRGTFNGDWKYELSANYGEFDEKTKVLGNLNAQRFLLAMDAVRDPASGQIVCRSKIDPRAAIGYVDTTGAADGSGYLAANNPILQQDIAACQPINLFGNGNVSQAAKNYVQTDTTSVGKITQLDIMGYVAGDTSGFFNLPGGPLAFSVGGEYRRETNFFKEDPLVSAGYTFYNAIQEFNPPSFEVKEAYGEVRVPILKDTPFFKILELGAAGRVADYKGATGTVYAYNFSGVWAPIQDIKFRANFARSVRAPNLSELYSPNSQNFATVVDPCSARNIGTGSQFRAANCAAAGIPASYDYVYTESLDLVSGGNPNLKAEKSNSYTYGVILEPRWIPGLSLSVDYYNIKVNNVISSVAAQQILNLCYDSPSLNNQFCPLFQRAGASGGPNGEQQFRVIEGSLLQSTLNFASLKTRGIDTELDYRRNFGGLNFATKVIWTHQLENVSFTNPDDLSFGDTVLGELGQPKDAFNWNVDLKTGPFSINYQFRYLGHMLNTAYENVYSFEGRPAQNADALSENWFPSVTYMDIRFGIDIQKGSSFYFGIDNLTDTQPPFSSTAIGGGSGIYDAIGRRFYAGFKANF
jgi:outer membrane receptor protein involved in Fe transport